MDKWVEEFDEKFAVEKAPNWWRKGLDLPIKSLGIEYNKDIKTFIRTLLEEHVTKEQALFLHNEGVALTKADLADELEETFCAECGTGCQDVGCGFKDIIDGLVKKWRGKSPKT